MVCTVVLKLKGIKRDREWWDRKKKTIWGDEWGGFFSKGVSPIKRKVESDVESRINLHGAEVTHGGPPTEIIQ